MSTLVSYRDFTDAPSHASFGIILSEGVHVG